MASVKAQIMEAIEKFKSSPVSDEILKETKDRVRYSFAMSMDSPDAIANSVSLFVWVTGDPNAINNSYEMFESVTPQDLQRVAKKYLVPDNMTIATISPDDKPVLE
jgi:zinc protease